MQTGKEGRLAPFPKAEEEVLDLEVRSLLVMRDVLARAEVRAALDRLGLTEFRNQLLRSAYRRGLLLAATEMVKLRQAGIRRAELLLMVGFLANHVEDLCAGEQPN